MAKRLNDEIGKRYEERLLRDCIECEGIKISSKDCCKEIPNFTKYNSGVELSPQEEDSFEDSEQPIYERVNLESLSLLEIEKVLDGKYQLIDEDTGKKISLTEEDRQDFIDYHMKRVEEVYDKLKEFD